jgi:Zn-finger protein
MPTLLAGDMSLDPSFGAWTINQYASVSTSAGAWPTTDTAPALVLTSVLVGFGQHGGATTETINLTDGDYVNITFKFKLVTLNADGVYLFLQFGSNTTTSFMFEDVSKIGEWQTLNWNFRYDATGETQNPPLFGVTFEAGTTAAMDTAVIDYVQSVRDSNVVTLPTYYAEASTADEWTAQGLRGEHWYLCSKCQFPHPKSETVVVTSHTGASVRRCMACVDRPRNDESLSEWNAKLTSVADGELRDSVKETP